MVHLVVVKVDFDTKGLGLIKNSPNRTPQINGS